MSLTSAQHQPQSGERQAPPARRAALVEIAAATVAFPTFTLGPVDLDVRAGEVLCVVGPNGGGKTTLLRSLLGLQPLSGGQVRLDGGSVAGRPPALLRQVGWIPDDENELLADLTCRELWELHAYAHARLGTDFERLVQRSRELASYLDFAPPATLIASFSHGMKKKAQLVAGLMHRPALAIFDEPRNGLDPIAIDRLERLVEQMRDEGCAIVIATHDLYYAQRVADRVAVLRNGRLVATGSPAALMTELDESLRDAFMRLVDEHDAT